MVPTRIRPASSNGSTNAAESARGWDEMTTTMPLQVQPLLTPQDRCDRCGAPAQVLALLRTGGELLFCRHHVRQHRQRLGSIGAELFT
jgi:ribosomal protein S14